MSSCIINHHPLGEITRQGRFVLVKLREPCDVLSTSHLGGGLRQDVSTLVNHQSCEASGHDGRFHFILGMGQDAYHHHVCQELSIDPSSTVLMGTAANMDYTAMSRQTHGDWEVLALATAGVGGNAGRAGEEATWVETLDPPKQGPTMEKPGTINIMVLINVPLRPGAMTRAMATVTEAKTAALMELGVASKRSWEMATGTGTDQCIIAAPQYQGRGLTWTGTHAKIGELIAKACTGAVREALRWQNGLEISLQRNIFSILGRFGLTEAWWDGAIEEACAKGTIKTQDHELFRKGKEALIHDPMVSACATAMGAIEERRRYGALPDLSAREALLHQAWLLAHSLARIGSKHSISYLDKDMEITDITGEWSIARLVFDASIKGWKQKWQTP